MIARWLLGAAFAALATLAHAQSSFDSPGGARVPGAVLMCLDGSGKAIPATSAGTCLASGGGGGAASATATAAAPSYSEGLTTAALSLNLTGDLRTISKQSGTWTVQPGNTANTTAWLVTGAGGTFPATQSGTWNVTNVSGTVSLPTGAATAANQSTEISSLATIATNTGAAIPAGSAIIGKVGIDQTTAGTTNAVSLAQIGATTVATGNGVVGAGVQRVSIASDNTAFAVNNTAQAGTANMGNVGGTSNVTPTDCSGTVTTGGTAQNAHTAQSTLRGMTIANLDATEVMWISFTTTAAASTTQSYPLAPATATTFAGLASYTTPLGFGYNTALSVVAATTGHKFSCTRW